MSTITVDVSGFRTPLDPLVIEKHLRSLKGVRKAAANFASASASVDYDEAAVSAA
jgi:Cu2+-exporting ATPase